MNWIDIACIVFVCVTANHLGLVRAVEEAIRKDIPIVNCPKCFTWWSTLIYTTFTARDAITVLAVSFLASYSALWLELAEGFIDKLYMKTYEKIYSNATDNTPATSTDDGNSAGSVPKLRKNKVSN